MLVICNLYFLGEIRELQCIVIVHKGTGYRQSSMKKEDKVKQRVGSVFIEQKTWDDRSITRRENGTNLSKFWLR